MVGCVVYFYKKVLGVPFYLPQGAVRISLARSEDRAIAAAKLRFARRLGVQDWNVRADSFDLVSLADSHLRRRQPMLTG
jgi:hypothetical protein